MGHQHWTSVQVKCSILTAEHVLDCPFPVVPTTAGHVQRKAVYPGLTIHCLPHDMHKATTGATSGILSLSGSFKHLEHDGHFIW
jgi:hypothetical protein